MTKQEAIKEMMTNGKKVTHKNFSSGGYIYMKDGQIFDEDNYNLSHYFWKYRKGKVWENNWSIYNTDKI